MKKCVIFLLCLSICGSMLSGCSGKNPVSDSMEDSPSAVSEEPEDEDEEPMETLLDEELEAAYDCGFVPEDMLSDMERTIRHNELAQMTADMIKVTCPDAAKNWEEIASKALKTAEPMERDDGMLTIYEAACAMGIGDMGHAGSVHVSKYYDTYGLWDHFSTREDIFDNLHEVSPYHDLLNRVAGWDYQVVCRLFALGMSSNACPLPIFSYQVKHVTFNDPLTCEEAVRAVYRLKLNYENGHGGYSIPETDWDDEMLSDAKAARDAILSSETGIVKGDEFILGETYNGTAYYVSNSGNDANDGLTPETAWATMEKVSNTPLAYGDAVFFERGGIWRDRLIMQYGVSYSAYGTGDKPILTGSPADIARPEKWTLHTETADGGKIWRYAENVYDCGVILFNKGEIVARKIVPLWDGEKRVKLDGSDFDFETELQDLEFFSWLDLSGYTSGRMDECALREKNTGVLYLRCDAGNPGEIYDEIEFSAASNALTTADNGHNAIDNLCFRCFADSAMDCNGNEYILYQNNEACWCGGGVSSYLEGVQTDYYEPLLSGGGMLLFGRHVTGRGNYIHDCENKGIAVVINGNGIPDLPYPEKINRTDVLAENNVVVRCGSSVYMMMEFIPEGTVCKFEDITIRNNYFLDSGYGWRLENRLQNSTFFDTHMEAVTISTIEPTGEVLFADNLFYRAASALIQFGGKDFNNGSGMPLMRNNTYVQDNEHLLFSKVDAVHDLFKETTLANSDEKLMERCVKEFIGDSTGTVTIR